MPSSNNGRQLGFSVPKKTPRPGQSTEAWAQRMAQRPNPLGPGNGEQPGTIGARAATIRAQNAQNAAVMPPIGGPPGAPPAPPAQAMPTAPAPTAAPQGAIGAMAAQQAGPPPGAPMPTPQPRMPAPQLSAGGPQAPSPFGYGPGTPNPGAPGGVGFGPGPAPPGGVGFSPGPAPGGDGMGGGTSGNGSVTAEAIRRMARSGAFGRGGSLPPGAQRDPEEEALMLRRRMLGV